MQKCDLNGRDCIANKSTLTFDCLKSCEGVYADTNSWWDWDPKSLKELIRPLLTEYENFKRKNARHFRFNSSAGLTNIMFGKYSNLNLLTQDM